MTHTPQGRMRPYEIQSSLDRLIPSVDPDPALRAGLLSDVPLGVCVIAGLDTSSGIHFRCSIGLVTSSAKSDRGLRPSFSAQVRWGEPGAPVDSLRPC